MVSFWCDWSMSVNRGEGDKSIGVSLVAFWTPQPLETISDTAEEISGEGSTSWKGKKRVKGLNVKWVPLPFGFRPWSLPILSRPKPITLPHAHPPYFSLPLVFSKLVKKLGQSLRPRAPLRPHTPLSTFDTPRAFLNDFFFLFFLYIFIFFRFFIDLLGDNKMNIEL